MCSDYLETCKWSGEMDSDDGECGRKTINDSVHGPICVHPLCVAIIDTLEFQRLRNISQCGLCKFVYPTSVHSRFEHSIGVYHLAGELINFLEVNVSGSLFTREEKLCIQIAGLVHDLGHGPFSHTWEKFMKKSNIEFQHEKQSIKMFDHLIHKNDLMAEFESYNLTQKHVSLIKDIILGKPKLSSEDFIDKPYLFEIIANSRTKVDVDKWDYMMRDGQFFGIPWDVSYKRLLAGVKLNKNKNIIFQAKLKDTLMDMFEFRGKMHKKAYQHRVCCTIEEMLCDALCAADKFYLVSAGNNKYRLTECFKNLEAYTKMSDYIFYDILNSENQELKESKDILIRIIRRDLYTCIGYEEISSGGDESNRFYKKPQVSDELKEELVKRFPNENFKVCKIEFRTGVTTNFKEICFDKDIPSFSDPSRYDGASLLCLWKGNHKQMNCDEQKVKEMSEAFNILYSKLKE